MVLQPWKNCTILSHTALPTSPTSHTIANHSDAIGLKGFFISRTRDSDRTNTDLRQILVDLAYGIVKKREELISYSCVGISRETCKLLPSELRQRNLWRTLKPHNLTIAISHIHIYIPV